ncbi:3-oxo-tetronate kinase [Pantoea sp. BAV 3049]|uniref:3-oxo-tetronate kinase n=1 Tax=Pantoea sp. BAV 3049 TaxID=2654188 RepID=UPI00131C8E62|nr:3-oxo-tetronate kinase [Pantoea sp. BAV 3049]
MRLGVIADDFTGATDIASFLVQNGMATVQVNGVPPEPLALDADAIVVSLKSRSCAPQKAVADSLHALEWLQQQGCERFYFKYCSTFDSTMKGNIGPVTDALLAATGESQTIISPSLPVNGRTVYQGHLFVMDQLLSDSGMRHHPVTPMTDSNLLRLMEAQAAGKAGLVASQTLDRGAAAVREKMAALAQEGVSYVVLDALNEQHLLTQGEAVRELKLVTGGSGLAIGLARQWANAAHNSEQAQAAGAPAGERAVVLSGSCSTMTNRQVARYRDQAPSLGIDVERALQQREVYAAELCDWVAEHSTENLAPLLFATSEPEKLQRIQQKYGAQESSEAVEQLFAAVVRDLQQRGWQRFIVAGGETSGVVAQTLGIDAFHIGPVISPGVPWVRAVAQPVSLALKSGNFGDENFFARAQTEFPL